MRHAAAAFNRSPVDNGAIPGDDAIVRRIAVAVILVGVAAVAGGPSCLRVGDDRYRKLPDADLPDATTFVPDAAPGPADAPPAVDAGGAGVVGAS